MAKRTVSISIMRKLIMSMFINFGYCAVCFNGSLSDGRYMNDDKKVNIVTNIFPRDTGFSYKQLRETQNVFSGYNI